MKRQSCILKVQCCGLSTSANHTDLKRALVDKLGITFHGFIVLSGGTDREVLCSL